MTLAQLQAQMFEWVASTSPVRETALLVQPGALSPDERVTVYAEMYWLRLRDVLRDEFELVRAVMGDEAMDVLIAKYLKAHPSTHFSLGRLGEHLPAFLKQHPIMNAPWVADLAALEWARAQSFVAPDSPIAEPSALASIGPQNAEVVRLTLAPCVAVLKLDFDIRGLFRALANQAPTREVPVPREQTFLVVFRKHFEVFHDVVSASEASALTLAQSGATLPALCEAFIVDAAEDAAAQAFTAIASWVAEGMVALVQVPPEEDPSGNRA
jgi:hypothetical protein